VVEVCRLSVLQYKMRWQWKQVRTRSLCRTSCTSWGGRLRKHP
jgi:hypothetical protein